jgi:hypothetical protein
LSAASRRSVNDSLRQDFPLLWEQTEAFDFAERLGGCTDPLMAEIDKAMRELYSARAYVREGHPS